MWVTGMFFRKPIVPRFLKHHTKKTKTLLKKTKTLLKKSRTL